MPLREVIFLYRRNVEVCIFLKNTYARMLPMWIANTEHIIFFPSHIQMWTTADKSALKETLFWAPCFATTLIQLCVFFLLFFKAIFNLCLANFCLCLAHSMLILFRFYALVVSRGFLCLFAHKPCNVNGFIDNDDKVRSKAFIKW